MPIEKQENGKVVKCKIIFINNVRFVASSLSSLTDNFVDGLHKDKCKDLKSNIECMITSDGLIIFN